MNTANTHQIFNAGLFVFATENGIEKKSYGSINSRCQFHQRFTCSCYARNNTANLTVFFAHLGSASVKAARRTLMKLSPDVKFSIVNCC